MKEKFWKNRVCPQCGRCRTRVVEVGDIHFNLEPIKPFKPYIGYIRFMCDTCLIYFDQTVSYLYTREYTTSECIRLNEEK